MEASEKDTKLALRLVLALSVYKGCHPPDSNLGDGLRSGGIKIRYHDLVRCGSVATSIAPGDSSSEPAENVSLPKKN